MSNASILIVEDEAIVALDVRRRLVKLGYNVTSCVSSGEEAIIKAAEEQPDLVLMDIYLKGRIDGIEAASQIYTHLNIPVIYGLSFGHIRDQFTIPVGVEAEFDTATATMTFLEAAVV